MNISKRLRVISDFISDNSFILDIGCDHALLDIYVTKTKKNVKAIASDIKEEPLKKAKENIKKYNANNVTPILANGLDAYKDGIDTVIISGLGSTTIVEILKNDKGVLNSIGKLIISTNNDYYYLRESVSKLGFYIKDEKIVCDKNKFYPVILFEKGKKYYTKQEYKYGPILLKNKNDDFINYLKNEKDKLNKINKNLSLKYISRKIAIKKEINYINKMLSTK